MSDLLQAAGYQYYGVVPTQRGIEYRLEQTATSGQTIFSSPYTVGSVDVYVNGLILSNATYTATNGVTITLSRPSVAGDIVKIISKSTALVGISAGYTQAQADAKFATIVGLTSKADISTVTSRGKIFYYGSQ
jgi:hypothetical protein